MPWVVQPPKPSSTRGGGRAVPPAVRTGVELQDWRTPVWRSARWGNRSHAGCDLIADLNTEILAIEDGIVYEASAPFYHGTNSMVVRHTSGVYVRYCEILAEKEVLSKGTQVKAGEVIAKVGKMFVD